MGLCGLVKSSRHSRLANMPSSLLGLETLATRTGLYPFWTSKTTLYSSDLLWHPASIAVNLTNPHAILSYEKNCVPLVEVSIEVAGYFALYCEYDDESGSYSNGSLRSSKEPYSFFVSWGQFEIARKGIGNIVALVTNSTGLFCEPGPFFQEVDATVSAVDFSISTVQFSSPRPRLPITTFNTTDLNSHLAGSVNPRSFNTVLNDRVEQTPMLLNMKSGSTIPRLLEFGIAATQMTPRWYLDSINLSKALQIAYRILFSLAVNQLMTKVPSATLQSQGQLSFQLNAVVVMLIFAILVQTALALLAALAMGLLCICWGRTSQLLDNPASVSSLATLVRDSPNLLKHFENCDGLDGNGLKLRLCKDTLRFRLGWIPEIRQDSVCLQIINTVTGAVHVTAPNAPEGDANVSAKPVRPTLMRPWAAGSFILTLFSSIPALIFCRVRIYQWNGESLKLI